MSTSEYKSFRVASKDYFVRSSLGSEGFFATAFLASTNEAVEDKVVIKILHPRIFAALLGKSPGDDQLASTNRLVRGFVGEAIILNELEKGGVKAGVILRGVSTGVTNLAPIDLTKETVQKLCIKYPAAVYTGFPQFLVDLFRGDDKDRKLLIESLDRVRPLLENLETGLPYLALEYVGDGYKDLDHLLSNDSLTAQDKLVISQQFAELLAKAHSIGIAYQDLKENHVFWNPESQRIKVIDWNDAVLEATVEQRQSDLSAFGKMLFRIFAGRTYLSIDAQVQQGNPEAAIPGIAALLRGDEGYASIDFGKTKGELPFALRMIIEGLVLGSETGRYRNVEILLRDLLNPGLTEWLSSSPVDPEFLMKAGRKADAKRVLGQAALVAADYPTAHQFVLDSLFFASSLLSLSLFLEVRFRENEETTLLPILKNVEPMFEKGDYGLAIAHLDNHNNPEISSLSQVVKELEAALVSARNQLSAGEFFAAKESYLRALVMDYRCEEARKGWFNADEVANLVQSAGEALLRNNFEQAAMILDEFRGRLGNISAVEELERKIQYGRHYQRALINVQNDRFDTALEEIQYALNFQASSAGEEVLQRILQTRSLHGSLDLLLDEGKFEDAQKAVDQLVNIHPESQLFQGLAKRIVLEKKAYKVAADLLEDVVQLVSQLRLDDAEARLDLARQSTAANNLTSPSILRLRDYIDNQLSRIDSLRQATSALNAALQRGELSLALNQIDEMSTVDSEIELGALRNNVVELKAKIDQVGIYLENGRYKAALETLGDLDTTSSAASFISQLKERLGSEKTSYEAIVGRLEIGNASIQEDAWEKALPALQSGRDLLTAAGLTENSETARVRDELDSKIKLVRKTLESYRAAEQAYEGGDLLGMARRLGEIPEPFTAVPRVTRLSQTLNIAKDEFTSLKSIILDLKVAFAAGDADACIKVVERLPENLSWQYSKQFYEDQETASIRRVVLTAKNHMDIAKTALGHGKFESVILELDQALAIWPDFQEAKSMRSQLIQQKSLDEEAERLRHEIQVQLDIPAYDRALELLALLEAKFPANESVLAYTSAIRDEAELFEFGVQELRKLRRRVSPDETLLKKLDDLNQKLIPLGAKANTRGNHIKGLIKEIDDLLFQHGSLLIKDLTVEAFKANSRKMYSQALEISNSLLRISAMAHFNLQSEVINLEFKLKERAEAISTAKVHIANFELIEAKKALDINYTDDDIEVKNLGIQVEQLIALDQAILSKRFDLAVEAYENLRNGFPTDKTVTSLEEILAACRVFLQAGSADLEERVRNLRSMVLQLETAGSVRLAVYARVLTENFEQLVHLEEQISRLVLNDQYREAQRLLQDSSTSRARKIALDAEIENALSKKISDLTTRANAEVDKGDYRRARNTFQEALGYADDSNRRIIEDRLRELDDLQIAESQRKKRSAEDQASQARAAYHSLVQWWKVNLPEHVHRTNNIPPIDVPQRMLSHIGQLLQETLRLDSMNTIASELGAEVVQIETSLGILNEIRVLVASGKYDAALAVSDTIKQRTLITALIASRRARDQDHADDIRKMFGAWQSLTFEEVTSVGRALLVKLEPENPSYEKVQTLIQKAEMAAHLLEYGNKAYEGQDFKLASQFYLSLLELVDEWDPGGGKTVNRRFPYFRTTNQGYSQIESRLKTCLAHLNDREGRRITIMELLRRQRYRKALVELQRFTEAFRTSEEHTALVLAIKERARVLIQRGEDFGSKNPWAAYQAFRVAQLLSQGLDQEQMRQASIAAEKVRPLVIRRLITKAAAIMTAGLVIVLAAGAVQRASIRTPVMPPSLEPILTVSYTSTIIILTDTATVIPTILPTISPPRVIALPRTTGSRVYSDQLLQNVAFPLGENDRVILCSYNRELDRYSLVRESEANCNGNTYWAKATDIRLEELLSPQPGFATTQLAIYDPDQPKNELAGIFLLDAVQVQLCKVSENGATVLFSYGDCTDPTGWVAEYYVRPLVEAADPQLTVTATTTPTH